jgi:hypothetical protein
MIINTDINILGSLADFNLIPLFLHESMRSLSQKDNYPSYTTIKTNKSIDLFEKAIKGTLLGFKNKDVGLLIQSVVEAEAVTRDSLLFLFWNASFNNELLNYLNTNVYLPAFYSGRIGIKADEVAACIIDLRLTEPYLNKWSDATINMVASKYLTLLRKFNLMEGSHSKTIVHPYLNDKMLMLFVYWHVKVHSKTNVLESPWLKYCFSEKQIFIECIMQRKFTKYIDINFTGDKLKIEPLLPYETIYHVLTQS